MNSRETDKEAKATKNTKNVWKWILGVGVILMLIAFWGGFFNHDEDFQPQSNTNQAAPAGSDTTMQVQPDTIMEHVRGTE